MRRITLKDAADLLAVSIQTLRRLRKRQVFTAPPRENANGSTGPARRSYLLRDEVEAFATGGEQAVTRLRTKEKRS